MVKSGMLSQVMQLKRNLRTIVLAWTVVIGISLIWNLRQQIRISKAELRAQV